MVMSMDVSADQTMSTSPPVDMAAGAPSQSPSPFQNRTASVEGDEHDDEHSKCSGQTIVTRQHQQAGQQQSSGGADDPGAGSSSEQRMVLSGGSSFDEDDKRLMMSVDVDEQQEAAMMRANLKLEQAELEARLTQAKSTRFGAEQQANVESSLVAQMRDIVEGANRGPATATAETAADSQPEAKTGELAEANAAKQQAQQPKSSSDSLNNQHENNGNSRASIDSACQKRLRHSRGHCRHHHNHHHHHHHHRHRHRQSVSGGSLPGHAAESGAANDADAASRAAVAGGSQAQPSHSHHHHHHGRHRHAHSSHPHHHHHHHHHQPEHKRAAGSTSKRSSVQRLSLAMIEPSGSGRLEDSDQKASKSNNSSMTSVSSIAGKRAQQQQTGANNPNQSKSSESPASDEQRTAEAWSSSQAAAAQAGNKDSALHSCKHGHGHHHYGHHHHHHHCHHRGREKRLVLDATAAGSQSETVADSDMQPQSATLNEPSEGPRRRPLQDLTPSGNISTGASHVDQNDDFDNDKATGARQNHPHHHHHHHHNHHHHQSHPHHRHHHVHHCTHKVRDDGETIAGTLADDLGDLQQKVSSQVVMGAHHHHHHCMHRHRHHYHHGGNNGGSAANSSHTHNHHCKPLKGHAQRQKSISQTNVDQISPRDSNRTLERSDDAFVGLVSGEPSKADNRTEAAVEGGSNDEVVKMETSPTPQSTGRRQSTARGSQQVSGDLMSSAARSEGLGQEDNPTNEQHQQVGPDENKVAHEPPSQEVQCAATNQENLKSSDTKNDRAASNQQQQQQQQQQANKLTRQMSSQSSRWSEKEGAAGARGGPGDLDGRDQNDHLRECAERALQPATINQGSNETRQMIESTAPTDKRCRLCWCCCCPCSALSAREVSQRAIEKPKTTQGPPSSPVGNSYPSLTNVPLEEIRSWGESFDKLMKCSDGRKVFQDFLRCEYSEENILFWAACEELKKEKDSKNVASKARDIYEDYISILSSKEVSLDSRVRDIINNNIKKPTSNIFDEAQLQIYTLMHRDSYPRFINSIMYKKLAQIPTSNSRKSSS